MVPTHGYLRCTQGSCPQRDTCFDHIITRKNDALFGSKCEQAPFIKTNNSDHVSRLPYKHQRTCTTCIDTKNSEKIKIYVICFERLSYLELNILRCHIVMEMAQEWFSELEMEGRMFMNDDEMMNLYDTIDNISVNSCSSESYTDNMKLIDQSVQTQQYKNKPQHNQEKNSKTNKSFQTPDPLVATTRRSSNTFTISFANKNPKKETLQFPDSLGYEATYIAKIPTTVKNNNQAHDHILAERKRREKLNQHFISISALLPNLKKMDKASVLEEAANYIKELQDRVKELEGLQNNNRNDVQECVISMKRSRIINSDDEYYSSDEIDSRESTNPCKSSPEIEVRISGNSVLVRIQCQKSISSLVNTLTKMQKLGLSIISSSVMPFAKTTTLITILAQIEDDFCMTTKELVANLQVAI